MTQQNEAAFTWATASSATAKRLLTSTVMMTVALLLLGFVIPGNDGPSSITLGTLMTFGDSLAGTLTSNVVMMLMVELTGIVPLMSHVYLVPTMDEQTTARQRRETLVDGMMSDRPCQQLAEQH